MVDIAGKWIMRGVRLVLTAVTYLTLPIVVYERAGARQAFRSAWGQVKKTWAGLLVGSGLTFGCAYSISRTSTRMQRICSGVAGTARIRVICGP